jgi:hypothetical protein
MLTCPRCGLISPDKSMRCDCGFNLIANDRSSIPKDHARWRGQARTTLWLGVALIVFGVTLTILTYKDATAGGGRVIVFYGAIASGLVLVWRGVTRLSDLSKIEARGAKDGKTQSSTL